MFVLSTILNETILNFDTSVFLDILTNEKTFCEQGRSAYRPVMNVS